MCLDELWEIQSIWIDRDRLGGFWRSSRVVKCIQPLRGVSVTQFLNISTRKRTVAPKMMPGLEN